MTSGEIQEVQLYAGEAQRPLTVSVFRPISSEECNFRVVQTVRFPSFAVGLNKVRQRI